MPPASCRSAGSSSTSISAVARSSSASIPAIPTRWSPRRLPQGLIPDLADYRSVRREVPYGRNCRVDFLLEAPGCPPCYLEIKNVHLMREAALAEFPDCVTARGARHLDELAGMVAAGARAILLFVIQIGSARRFAVARDIDPAYAAAFDRARAGGVETLAWRCKLDQEAIAIEADVPILA